MKAILDTSVLIAETGPSEVEAAISVVSVTELHFGLLIASEIEEQARRADRLAAVEAAFDPLPVTVEVARAWGRLAGVVAKRGGKPRRRPLDVAIAATAVAHAVPLLTYDVADLRLVADLVDVRDASA